MFLFTIIKNQLERKHVLFQGGIILAYLLLSTSLFRLSPTLTFVDTRDYYRIADQPLLSSAFWADTKPMGAPLFFKLFSNHTPTIAAFQWLFSLVAWMAFAFSARLLVRRSSLRLGIFGFFLLMSLSPHIFQWHTLILSESLSTSWFVLMLASWITTRHCLRKPSRKYMAVPILAILLPAFFWSFCRDTHMFFLLATSVPCLLFLLPRFGSHRFTMLSCALGFLALFLIQNHINHRAERWRFPLVNVIAQRILPDSQRTRFFSERNMPVTPEVKRFSGKWAYSFDRDGFEPWLTEHGKSVYLSFLLSHPRDVLPEPLLHMEQLFDRDLFVYGKLEPTLLQKGLAAFFFAKIAVWLVITALTALVFLKKRADRFHPWPIPLLLLSLAYPMMLITWHGDALEIARHAFGVNLQLRLGIFLFLFLSLDHFWPPAKTTME